MPSLEIMVRSLEMELATISTAEQQSQTVELNG